VSLEKLDLRQHHHTCTTIAAPTRNQQNLLGLKLNRSSNPQLRYMCQIALPQLLLINVVVDIYGLFSYITPKLLDEFARHTRSAKVGREPMAATVRAEVIFHSFGLRIVQTNSLSCFGDRLIYVCPGNSISPFAEE